MKLLRAPLVNSDGDSKDAFPNNLRGFAFSVYNMNILLEGLCKNLEYGKTVTLLREGISCLLTVTMECKLKLNVEIEAPTLESEGSSAQEIKNFLKRFEVGSGPLLRNDNNLGNTSEPFKRICTGLYPSFNSGLMDMNTTVPEKGHLRAGEVI
ncbi:unnamed protein product, partial [Brassica napus]